MAGKQPFERILSLVDRRKLFTKIVTSKSAVIVKLSDNQIISFRGLAITKEGHLDGILNEKSLLGAKQKTVVIFFYSGSDRYFVNTKLIKVPSGSWRILNTTDFYRLNRRESYRTVVPENIQISLYVTSLEGVQCRVQARVTDFSSGGLRMRWTSGPLAKGALVKGTLIWLKGKEVPIQGQVKHRTREGTFGVEFNSLDSVQANRLRLLSIELQQLVNYIRS